MVKRSRSEGRRGRNLELLVKRIREHQLPGAVIRSPEFAVDVDTGQRREVDVGVRFTRNGRPAFLVIECRDRGAVQAVEWIEQLISKKQSVGADILVAVTSSRFSAPARRKALKHGVVLARMSAKLPDEVVELASSFFITLEYLAPRIVGVNLTVPTALEADLEFYRYLHRDVDHQLTITELAQVWTTPRVIRDIPRFVADWSTAKFAQVTLAKIDAVLVADGQVHPIAEARISYELNHGEITLPLWSVQELAVLDEAAGDMDATTYDFGSERAKRSEVVVDAHSGQVRWDILTKSLLDEGKVFIGARLEASKPVSITTMSLEL